MKMIYLILNPRNLYFLVVTLCIGCASTQQFVPFPDQSKHIEDTSKARVYVFRRWRDDDRRAFTIYDRNVKIGNLGVNGYVCWERSPGPMIVLFKSPAQPSSIYQSGHITVHVKSNQVYYIKLVMDLEQIEEEEAKGYIKKFEHGARP
jgi:hypothetical protein